jgi:hypothetical protein
MFTIKKQLIGALLQVLLTALNPELLRKFADMALDFIEEKVLGSASEIDDRIVLPIVKQIRETFNIPDND